MGIEKLPTAGNRALDPSTASVPINYGTTEREGMAQGDAANRALNEGLGRQSGAQRPGNSPHYPTVTDKPAY